MHPAPRPNGATACSHGWSDGAAKPADAEPVETVTTLRNRPGRGGGSDLVHLRPSGAVHDPDTSSTGSATLKAASLHPWLQTLAPLGRRRVRVELLFPHSRAFHPYVTNSTLDVPSSNKSTIAYPGSNSW